MTRSTTNKTSIFAAPAAFAAALLSSACATPVQAQPAEAPLTRRADDSALRWGACPLIFPAGCEITVLHGDPARPNADVFLRVPGGYSIPAHAHSSAERMALVSGEMNVRYRGTAAETLTVGEYAYGPPGLPHEARCVSATPCTLFIAFEGPVDATPSALN